MLEEHEWCSVEAALRDSIQQIQDYRQLNDASLANAKKRVRAIEALEKYYEITGYRESDPDVLWHHRLAIFGSPCKICGKPLRTPKAKMCAECGAPTHDPS